MSYLPYIVTNQSHPASHSPQWTPTHFVLQCPCKTKGSLRHFTLTPLIYQAILDLASGFILNCVFFRAYLCTKRLLSRYASAVLSWYEYKMRLAKSRLYFLTWRKDLNCGGRRGKATETEVLGRAEAIVLVWSSERSQEQRYGESNQSPIYAARPVETCCCVSHHLYKRYRDVIGVKAVLPLRRRGGRDSGESVRKILNKAVTFCWHVSPPHWEIWQPLAAAGS